MHIIGVRLKCTCDKAMQVTKKALNQHGFEVIRNFDLCDALQSLGMPYPCTYHQSGKCSCNYVVLSVYAPADPTRPSRSAHQLLLHGHKNGTWLSVSTQENMRGETENGIDIRLLRALATVLNSNDLKPIGA